MPDTELLQLGDIQFLDSLRLVLFSEIPVHIYIFLKEVYDEKKKQHILIGLDKVYMSVSINKDKNCKSCTIPKYFGEYQDSENLDQSAKIHSLIWNFVLH